MKVRNKFPLVGIFSLGCRAVVGSVLVVGAISLLAAGAGRAEPASGESPFDWTPVIGSPIWFAGEPPLPRTGGGVEFVLRPGSSTTLQLGSEPSLLLANRSRRDSPGGSGRPEIWISGDGQFFHGAEWDRTDSSTARFLRGAFAKPGFVRLENPRSADAELRFQLFLATPAEARSVATQAVPSFQAGAPLPELRLTVDSDDGAAVEDTVFGLLDSGKAVFDVSGHSAVRVTTRYRFATADGRSRQTYRVLLRSDRGQEWVLTHETRLDEYAFTAAGAAALGRSRSELIALAPGTRQIEIEASSSIALRVGAPEAPDLLLPRLNRATAPALAGLPVDGRSIWNVDRPSLPHAGFDDSLVEDPATLDRALLWLARDNQFLGSGEQLVAITDALAGTVDGRRRARWARLRNAATWYRSLLPVEIASDLTVHSSYYLERSSTSKESSPKVRHYFRELHGAAIESVRRADFLELRPAADEPRYDLPTLAVDDEAVLEAPVRVRLLLDVARSLGRLQLDTDTGQRLNLRRIDDLAGFLPLPEPSPAEIAWALRPLETEFVPAGRRVGDLVRVASVELTLPAGTRSFSLRALDGSVRVSVGSAASRRFRLSESEYLFWLDTLQRAGWSGSRLLTALVSESPPASSIAREQLALRALWNHWIPVARKLRGRARFLSDGLVPASAGALSPCLGADGRAVATTAQCDLRQHLQTIERLGDELLAERIARQWVAFGADDRLTDDRLTDDRLTAGRSYLEQLYADRHDEEALGRVTATVALSRPSAVAMATLAEELLAFGEHEEALMVGSLLAPENSRPQLRLAAVTERWWRSFERLQRSASIDGAAATEYSEFWSGVRALVEGHESIADRHLLAGGQAGRELLGLIEVTRRRRTQGLGELSPLFAAWTTWHHDHPQLSSWQNAEDLVDRAAGGELLEIAGTTTRSRYYRATAGQPLRLFAPGSTRLRFEVRPVFGAAEEDSALQMPRDVAVVIATEGRREELVLRRNRPTSGLWFRAPGNGSTAGAVQQVGTKGLIELTTEKAGEIELYAPGFDLVVRVEELTPWIGIDPYAAGGLPLRADLTPVGTDAEAVSSVCEESFRLPNERRCFGRAELRLPGGDRSRSDLPTVDRRRRSLVVKQRPRPLQSENVFLPASRDRRAAAIGARLVPTPRQRRDADWRQIRSVQSSAGVRRVEGVGWQPEDPVLRLRRELLGSLAPSDLIASSRQVLGLDMTSATATRFEVTLELVAVAPLAGQSSEVQLQLDEDLPRTVRLTPGVVVKETVEVIAGEHQLKVWMPMARAGHLLRARLAEAGSPPEVRSWRRNYHVATASQSLRLRVKGPARLRIDEWRDAETRSSYREISEPGWQEVVLAADGRSEAFYRVFESVPAAERAALLPAFTRRAQPAVRPLATAITTPRRIELPSLSEAREPSAGRQSTQTVRLSTERRRFLEEEVAEEQGAEEFSEVAWQYRKGTSGRDTATGQGAGGNRTGRSRQMEVTLLGRARSTGEPTVGSELAYRARLGSGGGAGSWVLNLSTRGYLQEVESLSSEWSAVGRVSLGRGFRLGRRSSARATVSVFGRALSLDGGLSSAVLEEIDQDLFTDYKDEHRYGLRLAESFSYRPHEDVQFWTELSVLSNEELADADRAEVQMGWRQLLGPVRFDLRLRFARSFADDDRAEDLDRPRASLRWSWDRWSRGGRGRWELSSGMSYDFEAQEYSGSLGLSHHFSGDRGLIDFRPEAADFRNLRESRRQSSSQ